MCYTRIVARLDRHTTSVIKSVPPYAYVALGLSNSAEYGCTEATTASFETFTMCTSVALGLSYSAEYGYMDATTVASFVTITM